MNPIILFLLLFHKYPRDSVFEAFAFECAEAFTFVKRDCFRHIATDIELLPQILRATPGANSRDDSAFQHLSQNIFDGSRADIRENFAYLGFRYREKAIQDSCLDAG